MEEQKEIGFLEDYTPKYPSKQPKSEAPTRDKEILIGIGYI